MPTTKIKAAAAGGALATLVQFIVELCGAELPASAASAVGVLAALAFGYLTGESDTPGNHEAPDAR